jgi:hypothetical protein
MKTGLERLCYPAIFRGGAVQFPAAGVTRWFSIASGPRRAQRVARWTYLMKTCLCLSFRVVLLCVALTLAVRAEEPQAWRNLFNGRDLSGWVNVNTDPDTWKVRDGLLVCTGRPIGVMRSEKEYENFILHVEWMHLEPGGNSGVFLWSDAKPVPGKRLPLGLEVQMLELDWPKLHPDKQGNLPPIAYVHGELFGANGLEIAPDNPRNKRSMSVENRCLPRGQWNTYDVVAVDGTVKLSVNGKFVNGVSRASVRKGFLCLESEGAEIHFRSIRILELPPGSTASASATAKP